MESRSPLTHWVRDRARAARLSLEEVVKTISSDTATFYGLDDRGRIAVGYKADLNVIDFDALTLHAPEMVYDLPRTAAASCSGPTGTST